MRQSPGANLIQDRPGFAALLDRIEGNGVRTVIIVGLAALVEEAQHRKFFTDLSPGHDVRQSWACASRRLHSATTSGRSSLWLLRPSHLPPSWRLRSRACRSLWTRRPFSYSAKAPAIWRIILRLGSSLAVRSSRLAVSRRRPREISKVIVEDASRFARELMAQKTEQHQSHVGGVAMRQTSCRTWRLRRRAS